MASAGCDPFQLSSEYAKFLARPPGLAALPRVDADGCQWYLVSSKLYERFARGEPMVGEVTQFLSQVAALRLMLESSASAEETRARFPEVLSAQMSWAEERLLPAFDRMNADAKIYGKEDVLANLERYEPAGTLIRVADRTLLPFDYDGDCLGMARALAMHDQGTDRPRQIPRISLDAHFAYFALAGEANRCIQEIDLKGRTVLDKLRTKSALDDVLIRVESRKEELVSDVFADARPPEPMGVDDRADALPFDLEAVKAVIAKRMQSAQRGSLRWRVLRDMEAMKPKAQLAADIERETGYSRHAVRKAYRKEAEEIRRTLGI